MALRLFFFAGILFCTALFSQQEFETDQIETSEGILRITHLGHASLIFEFQGKTIHVDPYGRVADYSLQSGADFILITHGHQDHLDLTAIGHIRTKDTIIVCPPSCSSRVDNPTLIEPDQIANVGGMEIGAVHAYNIVHKRPNGDPYHIKGEGVGYVITFGDKRVYVAGDTEIIPEMAELEGVDIAFLPVNLPFTMTTEMAAEAVKMIKPGIFYPYHYGNTDLNELEELLEGIKTDFRVRNKR